MTHRNCEGPEAICQDEDLELTIEVLSTAPKLFIVENFLNSFEVDNFIALAEAAVPINSTGAIEGSIATARRAWVKRTANEITDTIALRAADVLGEFYLLVHVLNVQLACLGDI